MQAQEQCIDMLISGPAIEPDRRGEAEAFAEAPPGSFPLRRSRVHEPEAPSKEDSPSEETTATTGAPPKEAPPVGYTAELLAPRAADGWRSEIARFGVGVGLAALYGVALGSRLGGASLLRHAVGVPAAMVAVAGLGVPALTIVLTLFNAPLDPPRVLSATARAAASSGLVLGGFAPAAALFVTTSASWMTAGLIGALGLVIGGAVGLRRLIGDLWSAVEATDDLSTRGAAAVAFVGFTIFALALAARIWFVSLPLLRGGVL